jgi:hypothetical protein
MRSLTAASLLAACAFAVQAESFQPACTLSFDAIKGEDLKIDQQCGIEGAGDTDEKRAENRAKNNFCASGPGSSLSNVSVFVSAFGGRTAAKSATRQRREIALSRDFRWN